MTRMRHDSLVNVNEELASDIVPEFVKLNFKASRRHGHYCVLQAVFLPQDLKILLLTLI